MAQCNYPVMPNKKTSYQHFTIEDRRELESLSKKTGFSCRKAAIRLGKSFSAVAYELRKNSRSSRTRYGTPREYKAELAHKRAHDKRHLASFRGKKIMDNPKLRAFIEKSLLSLQSPEAIAGRLKTGREKLPYVSRNTIESYLSSSHGTHILVEINKFKRKYRRRCSHPGKPVLDDRKTIDERPDVVKNRSRLGDMEMDFIVSGKDGRGQLLTLVDRRSRKAFIRKLVPTTTESIMNALLDIKSRYSIQTITTDNDILLRQHNQISRLLNVQIYFCHPYSSWEKGSIENLNRYIRRFIKKGSSINSYSEYDIYWIEKLANRRFMEVLGYKTPLETEAESIITCAT